MKIRVLGLGGVDEYQKEFYDLIKLILSTKFDESIWKQWIRQNVLMLRYF